MSKKSTRLLSIILVFALSTVLFAGCSPENGSVDPAGNGDATSSVTMNIASLKGPTTMGMVKLMKDAEGDEEEGGYNFEIYGTADEIVPKLVSGEVDIALLPCNLASVLYNKTEGKVQVAAINTLSVLYVVETGGSINSVQDLLGKTVYSTGKGTTPEYSFNYILRENGIDPEKDLKIEFKSESTEIAALLSGGGEAIAVLPQPYISTVMMQNDKVRIALSFNEEWNKVNSQSSMVTGVLLVRKEFAEENKEAFLEFLEAYKASTEYVNNNIAEAAEWIAEYEIVGKAQTAVKALPDSSIVYIDSNDMKARVGGYLEVLFEANPQSVGGALPGDDFYFEK